MSEFLHTGWHEFLLPATTRVGSTEYLRVWVDMNHVVPMLRQLDLVYGDREHPYALDLRQIPDAQRTLLHMVATHLLANPDALRRVASSRAFATELWERFRVAPAARGLPYPPVIDQVDLEPHHVAVALPMIIDRSVLKPVAREKPVGEEPP